MKDISKILEGLLDDDFDVSTDDLIRQTITAFCDKYKMKASGATVIYVPDADIPKVAKSMSETLQPITNIKEVVPVLNQGAGILNIDDYVVMIVKDGDQTYRYGGDVLNPSDWETRWDQPLWLREQPTYWKKMIKNKVLWILPDWKDALRTIQKNLFGRVTLKEGLLDDEFDAQIPLGKFVEQFIKVPPKEKMTNEFIKCTKEFGWEFCGSRGLCEQALQQGKGILAWAKPALGKYGDKVVTLTIQTGKDKYLRYGGTRTKFWKDPSEREYFLYDKWAKHYIIEDPQELIKFIQQELS